MRGAQVGRLARERRGLRPLPDPLATAGAVVAESTSPQTGLEPPTELACHVNTSPVAQLYAIGIRRHNASPPIPSVRPLRLPGPEPRVPGRRGQRHRARHVSFRARPSEPCAGRAAVSRRSAREGPTIDGRVKPDLVGARLGLVLHLRPVRGLRRMRFRRNVGGDAARRRRGRARQGGEPEPSARTSCRPTSRTTPSTSARPAGTRLSAAGSCCSARRRDWPCAHVSFQRSSGVASASRATGSGVPAAASGTVRRARLRGRRRTRGSPAPSARNAPGAPRAREPNRSPRPLTPPARGRSTCGRSLGGPARRAGPRLQFDRFHYR